MAGSGADLAQTLSTYEPSGARRPGGSCGRTAPHPIIDSCVVGAIGVGSGTGEQDREVAVAALKAVPGAEQLE